MLDRTFRYEISPKISYSLLNLIMFPFHAELGIIIAFPSFTESFFDPAHQSITMT
jgi:hypothetical protein